ncbi:MAG: DUF4190 domain-containing protein [Bacteroidota bacterium]
MDSQTPHVPPINRAAVVSLIAAVLTVLSFCIAVAPIPLTGWVCYPSAFVLGLVALISGIASLAQTSHTGEDGRTYAWIGITVGTLSILGTACAVALGIAMFPHILAFLQEGLRLAGEMWQRIAQFVGTLR